MIKLAPYNLLARKKGKSIVINISIPSIGDLTLGRFLLEVEDPSVKVFHINKDILDFRISNLEAVIKGGKRTRLEKPKKRKKKQIKGNRPSNRYRGIWRTVRLQVLDRAKGICEICRRRKVDDVHHKMPVRFFKKPSHAHTLENLLAVCKQCHRKEHKLIREKLPLFNIMLHA
jgi:hypothetical protein